MSSVDVPKCNEFSKRFLKLVNFWDPSLSLYPGCCPSVLGIFFFSKSPFSWAVIARFFLRFVGEVCRSVLNGLDLGISTANGSGNDGLGSGLFARCCLVWALA